MDILDPRLRLTDLARHSIARAFAWSLALHMLVFGLVELGYRAGFWQSSVMNQWLFNQRKGRSVSSQTTPSPPSQVPIVFVEVDPAQASAEPPKETKYYSSVNSRAANPDTQLDTSTPKISGTQDKVVKTAEVPPIRQEILQPAPAPEPAAQEPTGIKPPEPQATLTPGDLALAKPVEKPDVTPSLYPAPTAVTPERRPHRRPMRIAEALQRKGIIAGEKMQQSGGVKRFSVAEGLDVKAMPFGDYDAAIISAIQQRWYDLLDERDYARNYVGKVALTFRLNSDGRVSEMRVAENEVSEILALICQRAVLDPAPFRPWPAEMRKVIGADYREVRFTFHHN